MNPVAKRVVTGLTVAALVISAILFTPVKAFLPVCVVLAVLAIAEYGKLLRIKTKSIGWLFVGAVVIAAAFMVLPWIAIHFDDGHIRGNLMLLYVLACVKFSDTGGFAFGLSSAKLMKGGNHKLCPTISPGKSWEGLLGSFVFSIGVSFAFLPWTGLKPLTALLVGVIAAIVGTAGDLIESKFKRWVGVKDSSAWKITNGMGGFLDMFDSILIAPAVIFALLLLGGCHSERYQLENPGKDEVIRVEPGDFINFELVENATTGYMWEAKSDDEDVEVQLVHRGGEAKNGFCGAPGKCEVTIKVLRGFNGPAQVEFKYRRRWEKMGPARKFTLSLFKTIFPR